MPAVRVNRVGLREVAKIEARKTEPININAKRAIPSAKACGEVFFFIVLWGDVGDEGRRGCSVFFYAETTVKFQENTPRLSCIQGL